MSTALSLSTPPSAVAAEFIRHHAVRHVRIGVPDLDGQWRCKHLPADAVVKGKTSSICDFIFGIDIHDVIYDPNATYTSWETGWPDLMMTLDPSTLRVLPWAPGEATGICDLHEWDGAPVVLAPREILRRQVERVRALGYEPSTALELEFFVLKETPESLRAKRWSAPEVLLSGNHSYHNFRGAKLLHRWTDAMLEYGLPINGSLTEWGSGQFEINLAPGDPVSVADNVLRFKHAIKEVASGEGFLVSFMARLTSDGPGSSGHAHVSLWDPGTDDNLFWDASQPARLSETALKFAAGLVGSIREFALLNLPFVNSYRRVLDYLSSPTRACVGLENRTTAFRAVSHAPDTCRIENRVPGSDSNPYLVLAALLAGGAHGLEQNVAPAEIYAGDGYANSTAPLLPRSLAEGIELFERSDLARNSFGDRFVDHFVHTRRWELKKCREAVTDWERERYLETV
jgi:glutamine synthetase